VKNYGNIAGPLTSLLKRNGFALSEVATKAFTSLRVAVCTTLVLVVPDFTKTFVLKCDALGKGLRAVLKQGRPLAFNNKQLCDHKFGKSTYEIEMMAILHEVEMWRLYVEGGRFQIKTDHHSRKYFLEQRF
jgi:hypothetical protein